MGEKRSEGRKQKQRKMNEKTTAPLMTGAASLEQEMALQRRDQEIQNRHEKEIRKLQEFHKRELQNAIDGLSQVPPKVPLWKRLFRRKADSIFIVYNHNVPVYCHKKACPTSREGVNFGIEAVTRDAETAFFYISRYFEEYGKYPFCFAKLLWVKIDKRNRDGSIVKDFTWKYGEWEPQHLEEGVRQIKSLMRK